MLTNSQPKHGRENMKKILTLGLMIIAISISSCTFNVSTGTNNATAPVSNTTAANTSNSAPTTTTNQSANAATAPKKEAEPATKADVSKPGVTRVQFAKGETSTTVTKDIPAGGSVGFLMNVQKGQTIGYTVGYDFNDSDLDVFLTEPGSHDDISQSARPKEPNEFVVKKSGDHQLSVINTTKKKVTITLYLDVE